MKGEKRTKVGYTVSGYDSVMGALQRAKYVIIDKYVNGSGSSVGSFSQSYGLVFNGRQHSVVGTGEFDVVIDKESKWSTTYQGECNVVPYMSFPVQKGSEYCHVSLPVNEILGSGHTLCGTNTYPTSEYQSMKSNEGDDNFVIGVGLSFQNFVKPFLEHFYGKDKGDWDLSTLRCVAQKRQMYAEILFPSKVEYEQSSGKSSGQYYVMHIPVVIDFSNDNKDFHTMYFPAPLLLVNGYNNGGKLGNISVAIGVDKTGNNVSSKIGEGDVTFPFSSSDYNHRRGELSGYSHSTYNKLNKFGAGIVSTSVKVNLLNGAATKTLVRVFFDEAAKQDLKISLDQQSTKELFRGAFDPTKLIRRETAIVNNTIMSGGKVWQSFSNMIHNKLTPDQCRDAAMLVAHWESSGNWKLFKPYNNNSDGQGISAGAFQFTQNAGGIKKYVDSYISIGGQVSDGFYQASRDTSSNYKILEPYADEFAKQADTQMGQLAQMNVWVQDKASKTAELFNLYGCKSMLELTVILGMVNHLPNCSGPMLQQHVEDIMNGDGADDKSILCNKIQRMEASHWIMIQIYYKNGRSYSEWVKNYKNAKYTRPMEWIKDPSKRWFWSGAKGHRKRCDDVLRMAENGEFDWVGNAKNVRY